MRIIPEASLTTIEDGNGTSMVRDRYCEDGLWCFSFDGNGNDTGDCGRFSMEKTGVKFCAEPAE